MGRKKLLAIVGLMLALLILSASSILGVVDLPRFLFSTAPAQVGASSSTVFFDPDMIVKDYVTDPGYQVGDAFNLYVNISAVTDLFAWQVNITWNPAILNITRIVSYGDFLARTASPDGTSRIYDIMAASNETGYAAIAESILGDYSGITGNGQLVIVEFEIVGYGWTDLTVGVSGTLPSTLLDSVGASITFDRVLVPIFPSDGYFRNVIPGDMTDNTPGVLPDNPDGDVDGFDLGAFADAYGTSFGQPKYNHLGDLTDDTPGVPPDLPDGDIDGFDLGVFADNYGRSLP